MEMPVYLKGKFPGVNPPLTFSTAGLSLTNPPADLMIGATAAADVLLPVLARRAWGLLVASGGSFIPSYVLIGLS